MNLSADHDFYVQPDRSVDAPPHYVAGLDYSANVMLPYAGSQTGGSVNEPLNSPLIPTKIPVIRATLPSMPQATNMTMPTIVGTAQVMLPSDRPEFTPQDLTRPMPSIVNTQPAYIGPPCSSFSDWVDQNPLLAAGALALLAWALLGPGMGRSQA